MKTHIKKLLSKKISFASLEKADYAVSMFNFTERIIFYSFAGILTAIVLFNIWRVSENYTVLVPTDGGEIKEGIIGTPRFINPVLAITDADKDLSSIIYSGLLKVDSNGNFIDDLAKSHSISEDGLTYHFVLKDNLTFQDNTPITTDDIEYTIQRIQDPQIKSPRRANWDGVTINKINSKEIEFIIKKPFNPFIENTTIGILPKHIWSYANADQFSFSEYNTRPIGTGPYMVKSVQTNSAGLPFHYELSPFKNYLLGHAHISSLIFNFYQNDQDMLDAFKKGEVTSVSRIDPLDINNYKNNSNTILQSTLPRIFGIFFNQNNNTILTDANVRKALSVSINRDEILKNVILGYGKTINSPIPFGYQSNNNSSQDIATNTIANAQSILVKAGWKLSTSTGMMEKKDKTGVKTINITISTSDASDLKKTADLIKGYWTKLGVNVSIKVFETGDLNQNVIRPRKYEALLFGEIIGRDIDLYPFWHSSQRNDPGLNIANYTNAKADKILEDNLGTLDDKTRKDNYVKLENMIMADNPAIFIYSPDFIYLVSKDIKNISLGKIVSPSERFADIYKWYINTEKVWSIFKNFPFLY